MSATTWAKAGDTVEVPGKDDVIEPVMLWPRCKRADVAYYCERCKVELRHTRAFAEHLLIDGPHHIAVRCPHAGGEGRWEAADDAQMRALVGVAS